MILQGRFITRTLGGFGPPLAIAGSGSCEIAPAGLTLQGFVPRSGAWGRLKGLFAERAASDVPFTCALPWTEVQLIWRETERLGVPTNNVFLLLRRGEVIFCPEAGPDAFFAASDVFLPRSLTRTARVFGRRMGLFLASVVGGLLALAIALYLTGGWLRAHR